MISLMHLVGAFCFRLPIFGTPVYLLVADIRAFIHLHSEVGLGRSLLCVGATLYTAFIAFNLLKMFIIS